MTLLACAAAGCTVEVSINIDAADADVYEFSAEAESVGTPDYALDVTGIIVVTDADDIIQSATGGATLTAGSVAGQRYVVADASRHHTPDQIDAAYLGGDDLSLTTTIPAADFLLVGDDLSVSLQRTVIVANIASGVRSYQVFEVTFHDAL